MVIKAWISKFLANFVNIRKNKRDWCHSEGCSSYVNKDLYTNQVMSFKDGDLVYGFNYIGEEMVNYHNVN
jgi:hypothetical protein